MTLPTQPSSTPRNRTKLGGIFILLILVVSVIGYLVYQTISSGDAALVVESNPTSIVFVGGESMGKTPIELEMKAEEVVLKLVPESSTVPLSPYETKVKLSKGVKTIVRRNFEEGEAGGFGEIISFEKAGSETSLAVVSVPDGVQVSVDGQIKGVAPLKIAVSSGEHDVKLSTIGFKDSEVKVKAVQGHKLTLVVSLARIKDTPQAVIPNLSPSPAPNFVRIKDTPVGYLRVRAEATVASEEIARVVPGEKYEVVEEDQEANWFKIIYEEGREGWVSGELVTQIDEE